MKSQFNTASTPNRYGWLIVTVLICLQGCAGGPARTMAPLSVAQDSHDRLWLADVDSLIAAQAVADGSCFPVPGYPYLRTDRFLPAMGQRLTPGAQRVQWLQDLRELDRRARARELTNLPDQAWHPLSVKWGLAMNRAQLTARTEAAADRLFAADVCGATDLTALIRAVHAPDEYALWRRVVGLYPLFAVPVALATARVQATFRSWHQMPAAELPVVGRLTAFGPPDNASRQSSEAIFSAADRDAWGLPKLTPHQLAALALTLAPVLLQDVSADYDRFGKVRWMDGRVTVDGGQPAVYYYASRTLVQQRPSLQINYAFWYSAREGPQAPWIERGPLDGLTLRVTLDSAGQPVMLDIMNNCGCYFFFVPRQDRIEAVRIPAHDFEPLIPAWMPVQFPQARLQLRINAGWHQVQRVGTVHDPSPTRPYELIPYEVLEALPDPQGQSASVFTPAGIMKNTSRIEPLFFFAMGIADIGFMRQRGHHAIKLLGREHFTNPDLYDLTFAWKTAGP